MARSATKRCDAPDRCVAFAAERAIILKKRCSNLVTVFACEGDASASDSDGILSGEEQDVFVCDVPDKFFDVLGKWGTNALAWQMGDLPVIYDNVMVHHVTCHIH